MAIFWSASAAGFFLPDHPAIPKDAVRITAARHRALLKGHGEGAAIVAGADGQPRLQRPPAPTLADRRAGMIRRVNREAARRIEAIAPAWRQLNDLREGGDAAAARFAAIDAIRAASDRIAARIATMDDAALAGLDIAADPDWPNGAAAA
jgi:hypothetical protein